MKTILKNKIYMWFEKNSWWFIIAVQIIVFGGFIFYALMKW